MIMSVEETPNGSVYQHRTRNLSESLTEGDENIEFSYRFSDECFRMLRRLDILSYWCPGSEVQFSASFRLFRSCCLPSSLPFGVSILAEESFSLIYLQQPEAASAPSVRSSTFFP